MSGKELEDKRLTFRVIWDDFVETTGFHAVNKIQFHEKYPRFRTLFWIVLWLLSAGYLLYIVYHELTNYYSYPTITTITSRKEEQLDFPVITICNLSPRNHSSFENDDRYDNYFLGITGIYFLQKPINWSDPFYAENGFFQNRTIQDLEKHSKNISRFVQHHTFDFKANYLNFTPEVTDLGLCVRTDPVPTSLFGGLYNLQVYLDLLMDEDYYSNVYLSSGIKVAIHDKHESVLMMNDGFVVPPGSEAFVEISRKETRYLPLPYKAFDNGICEEKDSEYTASKCATNCLRQKILDECGCADFMFESVNGSYCSMEKYMTCNLPTFWDVLKNGSVSCDCPLKCKTVHYDTSVTFGHFPSDFMVTPISRMVNATDEYIKRNYISLRIYYKNLQTVVTEQKPKYENVGDVFSNVGGQMGLFLGASILTITELCEFIIFAIWYILVHLSKRNVIVVHPGNKLIVSKTKQ